MQDLIKITAGFAAASKLLIMYMLHFYMPGRKGRDGGILQVRSEIQVVVKGQTIPFCSAMDNN
jgi:hypothetical protein